MARSDVFFSDGNESQIKTSVGFPPILHLTIKAETTIVLDQRCGRKQTTKQFGSFALLTTDLIGNPKKVSDGGKRGIQGALWKTTPNSFPYPYPRQLPRRRKKKVNQFVLPPHCENPSNASCARSLVRYLTTDGTERSGCPGNPPNQFKLK